MEQGSPSGIPLLGIPNEVVQEPKFLRDFRRKFAGGVELRRSSRRPFAREIGVVTAALDFFHEVAKRFLLEHAAARSLHFRVD